jgi:hypothetical protein
MSIKRVSRESLKRHTGEVRESIFILVLPLGERNIKTVASGGKTAFIKEVIVIQNAEIRQIAGAGWFDL